MSTTRMFACLLVGVMFGLLTILPLILLFRIELRIKTRLLALKRQNEKHH